MNIPSSKVDAKIEINPLRSQIFVVLMSMFSFVCLVAACLFLWNEKEGAWLPVCGAIAFLIIAALAYIKTYKTVDLDGAAPLNIISNGMNLSVDSKILSDALCFSRVVQLMNGASEAPAPAGMVTDAGEIIPNSAGEARDVVNKANASIQGVIKENIVNFKNGGLNESVYFPEPPIQPNQKIKYTDIADCD